MKNDMIQIPADISDSIGKLVKAIDNNLIDPNKVFIIDPGIGEPEVCTGQQMIDTAKAFVALAEAKKQNDPEAFKQALQNLMNLD